MSNITENEIQLKIIKTFLSLYSNEENGLYINFKTNSQGVILPEHLKLEYPENITIVLQRQFTELQINNYFFSVKIFFNGSPELIEVPYYTIIQLQSIDQSVRLTLKPYENENFHYEKFENEKRGKAIQNNLLKFDSNKTSLKDIKDAINSTLLDTGKANIILIQKTLSKLKSKIESTVDEITNLDHKKNKNLQKNKEKELNFEDFYSKIHSLLDKKDDLNDEIEINIIKKPRKKFAGKVLKFPIDNIDTTSESLEKDLKNETIQSNLEQLKFDEIHNDEMNNKKATQENIDLDHKDSKLDSDSLIPDNEELITKKSSNKLKSAKNKATADINLESNNLKHEEINFDDNDKAQIFSDKISDIASSNKKNQTKTNKFKKKITKTEDKSSEDESNDQT